MTSQAADLPRWLGPGGLIRLVYRLGRRAASGVLTLSVPGARPELLVLRRGAAVCAGDLARRVVAARLARAVAERSISASFDSGVAAYPPGAVQQVPLAGWARSYLEAQVDGALAERLVRELAGGELVLRGELAPEPLDDVDRRLLAVLAQPRRLAQIASLARAPRFRVLAMVHFLRAVGVLVDGAAERPAAGRGNAAVGPDAQRLAALRLLGVDAAADAEAIKRAYRRLARALHPDLQPHVDDQRRRILERRFAEVTAAYEALG